ncbi:MAG: diguanylate cyclase [Polyangia bacterium]
MRDRIFCVSDEEATLLALRQQLAARLGEGCIVETLRGSAAALRRLDELRGDPPVVLVVDHPLAGQPPDGLGALELLGEAGREAPPSSRPEKDRERAPGSPATVLLVPPGSEAVAAQAAAHAGLSLYLTRPWAPLQLQLAVENLVRAQRLVRKNERLLSSLQEQQREVEAMAQNLEARIRERTVALEEANRRLSQLAATDGLTGLYNHRYLQDHLVLEVERSLRTGVPLGMLMIDVDHFRLYNNRFGHQTGDEVLRRVARLISDHRRVNDVVARYGGEEFALLLINADQRVAANIAERLRARVAAEPFPQTDQFPGGRITISVGVAACPSDSTTAAGLLAAADAALFRAKHGGRNQVRIAGEPDPYFVPGQSSSPLAAAAGSTPHRGDKWR